MAEELTALVVGTGDMARRHLQGYDLQDHVRTAGIVGRTEEHARALADEFGVPGIYRDVPEALRFGSFDLASVCLPTYLHAPRTLELLQAGIHVLVEKPIALTVKDGQAMIDAAREAGRRLSVVFNRRFSSAFTEVRRRLPTLGEPLFYRAEDIRMIRPKRAMHHKDMNGGPFIDCMCHDTDLLRQIFGEVTGLHALGRTFADSAALGFPEDRIARDTGSVQLEFAGGAAAEICYGWGMPRGAYWIRRSFIGPRGVVTAHGDFGDTVEHYRADGVKETVASFVPDGHERQIAAFVAAIRENGPVPVSPEDALAALELSVQALAAMESTEEHTDGGRA